MHINLSLTEYNYIGVWHFLQNELNENAYGQMELFSKLNGNYKYWKQHFSTQCDIYFGENPKDINRFCDCMAAIVLTSFLPVELIRSKCNAIFRKQNKISISGM